MSFGAACSQMYRVPHIKGAIYEQPSCSSVMRHKANIESSSEESHGLERWPGLDVDEICILF